MNLARNILVFWIFCEEFNIVVVRSGNAEMFDDNLQMPDLIDYISLRFLKDPKNHFGAGRLP